MHIQVNGKFIETDPNGFLLHPEEWNEDVALELIKKRLGDTDCPLSDNEWRIIASVRQYYDETGHYPSENRLLRTLGTLGKHHFDCYEDEQKIRDCLRRVFSDNSAEELYKIAGLPSPMKHS